MVFFSATKWFNLIMLIVHLLRFLKIFSIIFHVLKYRDGQGRSVFGGGWKGAITPSRKFQGASNFGWGLYQKLSNKKKKLIEKKKRDHQQF